MDLKEDFCSEKHEATGCIFHIEDMVITGFPHFEPILPLSEGALQEQAQEKVAEGWMMFAKVLQTAIRENDFRREKAHVRIGVHEAGHFQQGTTGDRDVRVDNNVILAFHEGNSPIVSGAEAPVGFLG